MLELTVTGSTLMLVATCVNAGTRLTCLETVPLRKGISHGPSIILIFRFRPLFIWLWFLTRVPLRYIIEQYLRLEMHVFFFLGIDHRSGSNDRIMFSERMDFLLRQV